MERPKVLPVRSTLMPGGRLKHCPHCGSGFGDYSNYRRHLRIHTNERPFHCHLCGAQFTTNQNRQRHVRHVHAAVLCGTSTSTPSGSEGFPKESAPPVSPPKSPKPTKAVGEPTTCVCPHCEQELCSRPKLNRHLRYSCPFRDDVFASSGGSRSCSVSSDEDNPSSGTGEGHARHAETKRSRRIRMKRRVADIVRHSPLLFPRHEVNSELPPPLGSPLCSLENLSAITRPHTKTPSRVVCPYGECLSSFRTRGQWMNHVMACHPQELVVGNSPRGGEEKKESSECTDVREVGLVMEGKGE